MSCLMRKFIFVTLFKLVIKMKHKLKSFTVVSHYRDNKNIWQRGNFMTHKSRQTLFLKGLVRQHQNCPVMSVKGPQVHLVKKYPPHKAAAALHKLLLTRSRVCFWKVLLPTWTFSIVKHIIQHNTKKAAAHSRYWKQFIQNFWKFILYNILAMTSLNHWLERLACPV